MRADPFLYGQFGLRGPGRGHRYYYFSNPLEQLQALRPIRPYLLGLFSGIGGFERGGPGVAVEGGDPTWATSRPSSPPRATSR